MIFSIIISIILTVFIFSFLRFINRKCKAYEDIQYDRKCEHSVFIPAYNNKNFKIVWYDRFNNWRWDGDCYVPKEWTKLAVEKYIDCKCIVCGENKARKAAIIYKLNIPFCVNEKFYNFDTDSYQKIKA